MYGACFHAGLKTSRLLQHRAFRVCVSPTPLCCPGLFEDGRNIKTCYIMLNNKPRDDYKCVKFKIVMFKLELTIHMAGVWWIHQDHVI